MLNIWEVLDDLETIANDSRNARHEVANEILETLDGMDREDKDKLFSNLTNRDYADTNEAIETFRKLGVIL